ncbi:uncharacterized protein [Macaca nemestrina]|uniref:uncharacterized protein n=1 Tax=Macaca nemestrina TaxID=9545 RepID=UPI0039B8A831
MAYHGTSPCDCVCQFSLINAQSPRCFDWILAHSKSSTNVPVNEVISWLIFKLGTRIFQRAQLTIAKIWNQPKYPSMDEQMKKMWYIYTTEYYSAIKKNELTSFAATWMELEAIFLSNFKPTLLYSLTDAETGPLQTSQLCQLAPYEALPLGDTNWRRHATSCFCDHHPASLLSQTWNQYLTPGAAMDSNQQFFQHSQNLFSLIPNS